MFAGPGTVRLQYRGTLPLPVGVSCLNDTPLSPQDDMLKEVAEATNQALHKLLYICEDQAVPSFEFAIPGV